MCNQSLAATQVRQLSTSSIEREEEPNLSTSYNKGSQRKVPPTRNRSNPRRNPVIAVVQSHHIKKVNVWQRKSHATNVAEKDITAVYADQGKNVHEVQSQPAAAQYQNSFQGVHSIVFQC